MLVRQSIKHYAQQYQSFLDLTKQSPNILPGNRNAYELFLTSFQKECALVTELEALVEKFDSAKKDVDQAAEQLKITVRAKEALSEAYNQNVANSIIKEKSDTADTCLDQLKLKWKSVKSRLPLPAFEALQSKLQAIASETTHINPVSHATDDFSKLHAFEKSAYSIILDIVTNYCSTRKTYAVLVNKLSNEAKATSADCVNLFNKIAERAGSKAIQLRARAEEKEKNAAEEEKKAEQLEGEAKQLRREALNAGIEQCNIMISGLDRITALKTEMINIREQEETKGLRKLISDLPPLPSADEAKRQFILREIDNFTRLHTDKRSIPDLLGKISPALKELGLLLNPTASGHAQARAHVAASETKENVRHGTTTANINAQLSNPPQRFSPPSQTIVGDSPPRRHSPPSSNEGSPLMQQQAKGNGKLSQVSVIPYSLHQPAAQEKQKVNPPSNEPAKCACIVM